MLLNCGVREDSWESLGLQRDPTSQSSRKSVLNIHWKAWCWSWNPQYFGHLTHRTDSFEKTLMLGKIEGRRRKDDRRWDGWMASTTRWTWVWASSRSWWWTGRPGVLLPIGWQRVRHNWVTELTDLEKKKKKCSWDCTWFTEPKYYMTYNKIFANPWTRLTTACSTQEIHLGLRPCQVHCCSTFMWWETWPEEHWKACLSFL